MEYEEVYVNEILYLLRQQLLVPRGELRSGNQRPPAKQPKWMDGLKKRILTYRTSRLTNLRRAVLGRRYPKAKEALLDIRTRDAQVLLGGGGDL
jgi:hypothetical protein